MMSLEFSHGWVEEGRIFRVEVNPSSGSMDFTYVFSIDGVKFEQMPNQPVKGAGASEESSSRGADKTKGFSSVSTKRMSGGDKDSFDPFGDSSEPAPVHGSHGIKAAAKAVVAAKAFAAAKSQPVVDLFDAPVAAPDAFGASFDSFGGDAFAAPASKRASDPFASSTKASAFAADPFTSAPTSSFDQFSAHVPKPAPKAFDPFGDTPSFSPSPSAKPAYSASSISSDLAGLTFDAVPQLPVATPAPKKEQTTPVQEASKKPSEPLWTNNLVNLDLAGTALASNQKSSITGPPIGSFVKIPDAKPVMMQQTRPMGGQMAGGPPGNTTGMVPGQMPVTSGSATFAFSGLQGGYQPQQMQQQKPRDPFDFRGL